MYYGVLSASQSARGDWFGNHLTATMSSGSRMEIPRQSDTLPIISANCCSSSCAHGYAMRKPSRTSHRRPSSGFSSLKSKNCLQSPEGLGAFVNSVCQNLLFELYRSESRIQSGVPSNLDTPDERASAESALVTEDRKRQVRQVLEELPAKDRELLCMLFYEETDKNEICRRFSVDREYLRVLVHRAQARFRKKLLEPHKEGSHAHA